MKFLKAIFFLKIFAFLPLAVSAQNYYGGIPALFDDFSYTNTEFPIAGDSSGSLFGRNIWLTEKGAVSSRAWHRYGWTDPDVFTPHSGIEPSPDGISLFVLKGFRFGNIIPIFNSGFVFRHGTFASRIRCSELTSLSNSIQAFWLFSVDNYIFKTEDDTITYFNEVDFEYNNWFSGRNELRMHASTISQYSTKTGFVHENKEVRFFLKDAAGKLTDLGTDLDNPLHSFENKWFYYVIRLDSVTHRIDFSMKSVEEAEEYVIYGGAAPEETGSVSPVTTHDNFPRVPLRTVFNIGTSPDSRKDSALGEDMRMDVDWFLFIPDADVDLEEIEHEVSNFRSRNITRLNTTGSPLYYDIANRAHTAVIGGPDTISPIESGTWHVRSSFKNTDFEILFAYRHITTSGPGPWTDVYSPEVTISPMGGDSLIELRSSIINSWRNTDTAHATKTVYITPFEDLDISEIFPNPTSGLVKIPLRDDFKTNGRIGIYSTDGRLVTSYSSTERGYATIDLSRNPAGSYFIIITSGVKSFKSTVTVVR